jgi:Protein of unknown function (DUF3592)
MRHAEGGAERRARGLRRAAGMRPVPVRRPPAGSFPLPFGRVVEALTITGAVFAGLGVLLLVLGVVLTRANRRFDRRAVRAPGRVTGVKWEAVGPRADRTLTGFPELRFTLPDGREIETVARTGTTFDAMREGSPVTVLYDPADPSQARVDSPSSAAGATLAGAAFLVIGAVLVLVGGGLVAAGIALDDALPAVSHA